MSDRLKILKNIAILISGTGSNMEAIINDTKLNDHPGIVKFVLSNRSDALGLLKAQKLGIKTFVFPVNRMNSLENFEKKKPSRGPNFFKIFAIHHKFVALAGLGPRSWAWPGPKP